MSFAAAVVAAGLVARAAAAPASAGPGDAAVEDVHVTADRVSYDVRTGRVLLEGNAIVRRGAVVVRSRSATWDPQTSEVRASGQVLLTDPTRVVAADAIRAVLGGEVEAEGVLAFVKDRPVDLSGLSDAAAAARTGRNRLTLSGARLRGAPDGRLRLARARLTLCDCPGGGAPSWEVTAREADVIPGERAILSWPVLRVTPRFLFVDTPVPVLVLPWLYVPLGDRQTGLLIPTIGSTEATGFSVAQPVFVTLGRSADATLTVENAFGRARADVAEGKPAVRGPGARLELRWAPAEAAEGRMELAWVDDLDAEARGAGGGRWALTASHAQPLGARTSLAAGLRLAGDPVWVRDMTADVLGRSVPYRRSEVLVSHRRDGVVVEGTSAYHQPLRPDGTVAGERYGTLGSRLDVASRWASAAASLVPVAVGPLRLEGRAGAARFGPSGGGLDVAGRPAATRADARAEVSAPLLLGGALTVAPFVRGAALGYQLDEGTDAPTSAWAVTGATVETELSRRHGKLRHAIVPRLEWRAGTRTAGDALAFPSYDALDRSVTGDRFLLSATPGPFQQLRAAVETRVDVGGTERLRAEIGQDVDLRAGRLAETFAAIGTSAGPFAADARASFFAGGRGLPEPAPRISSGLDRFTELRASASLQDRRGDAVQAGFFAVGPGGAGRLVVGVDPLFDVRPAALGAAAAATAGVRASLGSARLAYDALFPGRATFAARCEGPGERRLAALHVQQHSASVTWDSPCRCFRIVALGTVNDCGGVAYHASIDLGGLAGALAR